MRVPLPDYPVLEASADLYVFVNEADISCAVPRDHCHCAVAQAIKRAVGRDDTTAMIYPSVAYVLMPCDPTTLKRSENRESGARPGGLAWHRFRVNPTLGKQILSFDETGEAAPGGYRFQAPTPGSTRAHRATTRKKEVQNPGSRGRIAAAAPWRRSSTARLGKATA